MMREAVNYLLIKSQGIRKLTLGRPAPGLGKSVVENHDDTSPLDPAHPRPRFEVIPALFCCHAWHNSQRPAGNVSGIPAEPRWAELTATAICNAARGRRAPITQWRWRPSSRRCLRRHRWRLCLPLRTRTWRTSRRGHILAVRKGASAWLAEMVAMVRSVHKVIEAQKDDPEPQAIRLILDGGRGETRSYVLDDLGLLWYAPRGGARASAVPRTLVPVPVPWPVRTAPVDILGSSASRPSSSVSFAGHRSRTLESVSNLAPKEAVEHEARHAPRPLSPPLGGLRSGYSGHEGDIFVQQPTALSGSCWPSPCPRSRRSVSVANFSNSFSSWCRSQSAATPAASLSPP